MTENVKELQCLVIEQQNLVQEKEERIKELENQLHYFKRDKFGKKSEKLSHNTNTNLFGHEAEPVPVEGAGKTENISYTRKKPTVKGHGRNEFADHLEVKEVTVDIPEKDKLCSCCGKTKKCIDTDESLKYEAVPEIIFIRKILRPKYACSDCAEEGVVQAKMPLQVIPGGNCGTSLINHVIVSKFVNHMPLERQAQDFKRQGIDISPSTMLGWLVKFYEIMTPLYELMKSEIKSSRWVHSDDTTVPVMIKRKKGKAHKGYFWVYIGENTNTVFEYTHSRKGKNPQDFLEGYKGYLHADAYAGYDKLYKDGNIKECACWSHGRRKFFDAYDRGDKRALRVLELCGRLFLVERYMKEKRFTYAQIKEIRKNLSRGIIDKIKKWINAHEFEALPGSDLGKAISYMNNHWRAFLTFMEEGYLSLENNLSERQIRKIVLGRQNWIHCGSESGAKRSALIYSFMGSCKLLDINPTTYLNDVLEKIIKPGVNLTELTPIEWKKRNTPAK